MTQLDIVAQLDIMTQLARHRDTARLVTAKNHNTEIHRDTARHLGLATHRITFRHRDTSRLVTQVDIVTQL